MPRKRTVHSERVDLIEKAREAMLAAVQLYNAALNFLQFVLRFFERSQCALSSHGSFGDMRVLIEFRRQNFGGCT
jgi:hypothetical protein